MGRLRGLVVRHWGVVSVDFVAVYMVPLCGSCSVVLGVEPVAMVGCQALLLVVVSVVG